MTSPKFLSDAQWKEAIELYLAGFNPAEIGRHFGASDATVRNHLRDAGLEIRSRLKLSSEQIIDAACLYLDHNISTLTLGRHFGTTQQTVATALQKAGVTLRPSGGNRRLALREDAFDELFPTSAYWLGIMATDGCVTGTGSLIDEVKIGLKFEDLGHLLALREFLGSDHAIGFYLSPHPTEEGKFTEMCRFAVRSRRLAAALAGYGIVPRKTYGIVAQGGAENSLDFWRGSSDGDGHLGIHASNQGPDATFKFTSASRPFAEQCRVYLKANGVRGDNAVFDGDPDGSLGKQTKFTLKLGGNAALDAVALLYVAAPDGFVLARKVLAAADMILCGSRGELVGTIREPWKNDRAVAWAKDYLDRHPQRGVRENALAQPPVSASDRAA